MYRYPAFATGYFIISDQPYHSKTNTICIPDPKLESNMKQV